MMMASMAAVNWLWSFPSSKGRGPKPLRPLKSSNRSSFRTTMLGFGFQFVPSDTPQNLPAKPKGTIGLPLFLPPIPPTRAPSSSRNHSARHPFCAFHLVGYRGVGIGVPQGEQATLARLRGLQC